MKKTIIKTEVNEENNDHEKTTTIIQSNQEDNQWT